MDTRLVLILGIAVVATLVVGGVWAFIGGDEHGENDANSPDGNYYICAEADCGHEFTMTVKERAEYNKAHWGQAVLCPKCKRNDKSPIRAGRCKSCQRYFPVVQNSAKDTCADCDKPVGP